MSTFWRRNVVVMAVFAVRATACGGSVGCGGAEPSAPVPAAVTQSTPAASACTKDTDCKGERVCENSACVDPPAAKK